MTRKILFPLAFASPLALPLALVVSYSVSASAGTLTVQSDLSPIPYSVNQLTLGSGGVQSTTATVASPSEDLNWYWITSSTAAVFNYTVVYSPTSSAFAAAEVFRVDPSLQHSGCEPYCGTFLAYNRDIGTTPLAPVVITGSVNMVAGSLYLLELGLYSYTKDGPYTAYPVSSNGSYTLGWNFSTTAIFSSVMNLFGGDPRLTYNPPPLAAPMPASFPLFATIFSVLAIYLTKRRGNKRNP